jgi:single-strand DNA-binding protein
MNDLNRVIIIGRLTRDPELKHTQSGTALANFSIASNKSYKSNGETKDQVNFFNCSAWSKLAETICKYCKKGQRIGIEGRLQQRTWDDQNGEKKSAVDIVVESIQFLEGKKEGAPESAQTDEEDF